MGRQLLHGLLAVVLLPVLLSLVVYYGFCTNYTNGVFHEAGFRAQYESGVYKYRVLGPKLLLATDRWLRSEGAAARYARRSLAGLPTSAAALDDKADATFYAAYVLQNTVFLVLCSLVLYVLQVAGTLRVPSARTNQTMPSPASADGTRSVPATIPQSLVHLVAVGMIALTQYVIVPYDNLSYFLLLLSMLLIVRPFAFSFPLLLVTLVVSTLARESSALTLSFYLAYHWEELRRLQRRHALRLLLLIGAFLATYVLVRVQLGWDRAIYQSGQLHANLTRPLELAGMALLPVVCYLICLGSTHRRRCLIFCLAAAPYVGSVLLIARTWETRLWVPVWLPLLVLAWMAPSASAGSPAAEAAAPPTEGHG